MTYGRRLLIAMALLTAGCITTWAEGGEGRQAESRTALVARLRAAYLQEDLSSAKDLLAQIVVLPDATALDFAAFADIHQTAGDPATAEKWYLKALRLDPGDDLLYVGLGEIQIEAGRVPDAIKTLEPRRHVPFDERSHPAVLTTLSRALRATGKVSGGAECAMEAVLVAPRDQEAWNDLRGYESSILQHTIETAPQSSPIRFEEFAAVLRAGPAGDWSGEDFAQGAEVYKVFAARLENEHAWLAMRFREVAGMALIRWGVRLARMKMPIESLRVFALAEQEPGLDAVATNYQLAALRDMTVGYVRIRRYLEALGSVRRLFELCHSDPTNPEKCPVFAVDYPLFAKQAEAKGRIPQVAVVHAGHLGLVLRDARANISFDLETLKPRYSDGHDFVGHSVEIYAADGESNEAAYAATSPEEDRVEIWTFASSGEENVRKRLQVEIEAGRYELPVKLLLHELGLAAIIGIPMVPRAVKSGSLYGTDISELRELIRTAKSVPEATSMGMEVAIQTIELYREFGRGFSGDR